MPEAVGMVEVSSIAMGYVAEDAMLKAADVRLLAARTICSGKYLVAVGGNVSSVQSAIAAATQAAESGIIDYIVIPNVHPLVFPAITGAVELRAEDIKALGVIETFSASTAVEAADAAVKAANVIPFRVHLAMALGGKGLVLVTGDVSACQAAVAAGAEVATEHGLLVNKIVIPGPHRDLFREFI